MDVLGINLENMSDQDMEDYINKICKIFFDTDDQTKETEMTDISVKDVYHMAKNNYISSLANMGFEPRLQNHLEWEAIPEIIVEEHVQTVIDILDHDMWTVRIHGDLPEVEDVMDYYRTKRKNRFIVDLNSGTYFNADTTAVLDFDPASPDGVFEEWLDIMNEGSDYEIAKFAGHYGLSFEQYVKGQNL